jgi:HlyD family secretion protein
MKQKDRSRVLNTRAQMATTRKRRKIVIFSLLGLVLAALTVGAVFHKGEAVITVQTEKVLRRNITEIVSANGKVQPVLQVKISPEVSGEIMELPVKEGQCVQKGDLIVKIRPDFYLAARNQSEAAYKGALAGKATAEANLRKAEAEFRRNGDLYRAKLISDSAFDSVKADFDVATAQLTSAEHQVEMSRASLTNADVELAKTTIVSPLTGTISQLQSQVGERVVGTATMAGTEIMTIADLNEMEARVDIGETDVTLIHPGQTVRLEVDAFKDQKFTGTVTEIADSAKNNNLNLMSSSSSGNQDATKFEVKIRIKEKEAFRPGMSVTADIETRSRTNVLTVPFASVTTRLPKEKDAKNGKKNGLTDPPTNSTASTSNATTAATNSALASNATTAATNSALASNASTDGTNSARSDKKKEVKPVEVVFIMDHDHAKMVKVKPGIFDDSYYEVVDGVEEGQEVISGGFKAISKDLEDGKKIKKGPALTEKGSEGDKSKS